MDPVLQTALVRAAWSAIPIGAVTALGSYQASGHWTPALVAGGLALFGVLVSRGGIEGWMDVRKAAAAKLSARRMPT